jgi:hypothetical protein
VRESPDCFHFSVAAPSGNKLSAAHSFVRSRYSSRAGWGPISQVCMRCNRMILRDLDDIRVRPKSTHDKKGQLADAAKIQAGRPEEGVPLHMRNLYLSTVPGKKKRARGRNPVLSRNRQIPTYPVTGWGGMWPQQRRPPVPHRSRDRLESHLTGLSRMRAGRIGPPLSALRWSHKQRLEQQPSR